MEALRQSKKAPGIDAIRIPGEGSYARRRKALETGVVQIDKLCWADSLKLADELGITAPRLS